MGKGGAIYIYIILPIIPILIFLLDFVVFCCYFVFAFVWVLRLVFIFSG